MSVPKILQGADSVKIHGQGLPIKAQVEVMHGLTGHGDYVDIEHWLKQSALRKNMPIQLVHGDPDALDGMRDHLRRTTTFDVNVAGYHNILTV